MKYGAWAPLRFSSMLSWPATGTTRISVTTGREGTGVRWGMGGPSAGVRSGSAGRARRSRRRGAAYALSSRAGPGDRAPRDLLRSDRGPSFGAREGRALP
ncbi:hypothetical protein GCM10010420_40560 [Streptomyces glaucosporus]|uniref:Uncharacterized protein n=1 Tax=Streptomyces glaucosporus TaxID=284044 RepID=A0ABN3ILH8_9ACTN